MDTQKATQANDLFTEGQLTQEDLQAVVGGQEDGYLTNLLSETQNALDSLVNDTSVGAVDAAQRIIRAVLGGTGLLRSLGS